MKAKTAVTKKQKKDAGIDLYAKTKHKNRLKRYQKFLQNEEIRPLFSEEEFAALDASTQYTTLLKWHCMKCDTDFEAYIDPNFSSREGIPARCKKCHPLNIACGTSQMEKELQDFIVGLGVEAKLNDRKMIHPLELDVYVPSKSIAFEFDGLYWHSEGYKDFSDSFKHYHLAKTEMCEAKGI